MGRKRVVIVGGGFGGLTCAQSLARVPVDVVLVDRTNHHLFQPLLYQVAMAGLSPADIASPIRSILSRQENVRVLLGEVTRVDLAHRRVLLEDGELAYDYLVLATGAETSYFGHDEWRAIAPGLKCIEDAIDIRQRVLLSFEVAERTEDEEARKKLLSFVVIGGGPTGVELAGALAELSRFVLARDFRSIRPESAKVILLEGGPRILASFPADLSRRATEQLAELGVQVRTNAMVTRMRPEGVDLDGEHLPASVVLWAAGIRATPITRTLGVGLDRSGRVAVLPDLAIEGHPEAFVIGDACLFLHQGGQPLPGVSPVAMQQARTVAKSIRRGLEGGSPVPFHYLDKGAMATIGRSRAIAQTGRIHLSGFLAWLAWLFVHIWYLIGFRNRFVVLFTWFWSYVTYRRGARLITDVRHELELPEGATVSSSNRADRAEAALAGERAPQASREERA
jgi:NADH:quinone reductase (non-electrogenic)